MEAKLLARTGSKRGRTCTLNLRVSFGLAPLGAWKFISCQVKHTRRQTDRQTDTHVLSEEMMIPLM